MLLKAIARILVKHAGNAVGLGVAGDAVLDLWDLWNKETPDQQEKLAEVQHLAGQSAAETRQLAQQLTKEEASDQPETVRDAVASYLTQVPAMVRRSLKRPADPTGQTIPSGLLISKPEDMLVFLPPKTARFKVGDFPIPGVDWQLVELLGVGGFGEVWKACNPGLNSVLPVALKFCTDTEAARALQHEATILNQVMGQGRHPGIVQLKHTYLRANPPCLEYELIEGGDLTGLIHDWHRSAGGCSPRVVNEVMVQLATVVGFAHRLNPPIVHRDLKPANILVEKSTNGGPTLKVADFGIGGVAAGQAIKEAAAKPERYFTAMATGTCTPLYASRQQAAGLRPDPRDDVFALGVIWLQMLTGDLSTGRPGGSAWRKKLTDRGLPTPMVELMERCFEDLPEDRPDDAIVLAEQLSQLITPSPADKSKSERPPPQVPPAITGTGVRTLYLKAKGIVATGYEAETGFVVLARSQAVKETVPSFAENLVNKRNGLIQQGLLVAGTDRLVLTKDCPFESASFAASVLLGRSANGRIEWKDADGRTLKEIQKGTEQETATTAQAIKSIVQSVGGKVTAEQIKQKINSDFPEKWKASTVQAHLYACVVNNPKAYVHHPYAEKFLFHNTDGTFEIYAEKAHGPNKWALGDGADSSLDGGRPDPAIEPEDELEGDATEDTATTTHGTRERFWEKLFGRPAMRGTRFGNIPLSKSGWVSAGLFANCGVPGLSFVYVVNQRDARVELYIDRGVGNAAENKELFDQFHKIKDEIEEAFGGGLSWERLDDKRGSRIADRMTLGGYRSEESKWPEIQDAMIDAMMRLEKALAPHLATLNVKLASKDVVETIQPLDTPGPTGVRSGVRFTGHTGYVNSAAFSPDGRQVLSGSTDKTVRLWDAISGQELRCFQGHTKAVWSVAFSPDGRQAVSGAYDNSVRLWDVESGRELRCFQGDSNIMAVVFCPDGRHVLSGGKDPTMRLWEVGTEQEVRTLQSDAFVWSIALSLNGKYALSNGAKNTAILWDMATGDEVRRFRGHTQDVWVVALSADGRSALSAGMDKTVRLWKVESGEQLARFKGHENSIWGVGFSPDGSTVVSGGNDKTVRIWDVATGEELTCFKEHTEKVTCVAFSPDGRRILSASRDKTMCLWAFGG